MNVRERICAGLIFVPLVALVTASAIFLYRELPRLERVERTENSRIGREAAEALVRTGGGEAGVRGKGWRGRKLTVDGREIVWGLGDGFVWVADDGGGVRMTNVETVNAVGFLIAAVAVGLTVILVLTVFTCAFFVHSIRMRDDFIAATAHDLTTPLFQLRIMVGRDAAVAARIVEHFAHIVANLKAFLGHGGMPKPVMEEFDLRKAFDDAYALFADDFAEEKSGEVQVSGALSVLVEADRTMTAQIMWNLLSNALKYAAPHGPVRITFSRTSSHALMRIVDSGPGLTAFQRKMVFRRYYRARSALATGKGGFGIGLCTARQFAAAMGGDVQISENFPRGCVFTLMLPCTADRASKHANVRVR